MLFIGFQPSSDIPLCPFLQIWENNTSPSFIFWEQQLIRIWRDSLKMIIIFPKYVFLENHSLKLFLDPFYNLNFRVFPNFREKSWRIWMNHGFRPVFQCTMEVDFYCISDIRSFQISTLVEGRGLVFLTATQTSETQKPYYLNHSLVHSLSVLIG